jgi:hypothetical protein
LSFVGNEDRFLRAGLAERGAWQVPLVSVARGLDAFYEMNNLLDVAADFARA